MPVDSSLNFGADKGSMRCVVNESGEVLFASSTLGWHLGTCSSLLTSKNIDSIMDIVSSYDLRERPKDFSEANSGFYEVALLRANRDPLLLQARIDLIETPDNRKYKVIWVDPDNKIKFEKSENFSRKAREMAECIAVQQEKELKVEAAPAKQEVFALSKESGDLDHFVALSDDILAVYDRQGKFLRGNTSFNLASGYSDGELQNLSFIELMFPEDRPAVNHAIGRLYDMQGGSNDKAVFESRICGKAGNINSMKWVYQVTSDAVYITGRDVTEIKLREAEIAHREQQLAEAQKIGRMGHWYLSCDTGTMEWSEQIYAMFGVDRDFFTPTVERASQLLFHEDRNKMYREFHKAMSFKGEYNTKFRLMLPGGDIRYIYCEGRCKIDENTGDVNALFGIMQDITESTLHERALNDAKEAAEAAYASKTRFLANMSHELRTPLNAIIGFSEMMQQQLLGPLGNSRYLEYVGGIRQSGEHLLDLINDMLDMSKIEIGKYEINPEEINLSKLVHLSLHMIEGRAQEAGVSLVADKLPDDIRISADRRGVLQILLNLLSNSVKFTPEGGTIEVECREVGSSEIELVVSDTGIGIPADKLDVVTKPFEQVKDQYVRNHTGSGLGLAITKDLAELHGGKLTIASKLGEGTSVFILLPKVAIVKKAEPAIDLDVKKNLVSNFVQRAMVRA